MSPYRDSPYVGPFQAPVLALRPPQAPYLLEVCCTELENMKT